MDINAAIEDMCLHYSSLGEECRQELKALCTLAVHEKGTLLVKEGQLSGKNYYIVKGCVRACYLKDGKDITDWFAFEHEFINAINSYYQHVPSPHYIEVLEQSIILEMSRDTVNTLAERYHDFALQGTLILGRIMLQLQQRIVSLQFESAQQKYTHLVHVRPDITQRVALTHIASYLGITLETLSRIRNPKRRI